MNQAKQGSGLRAGEPAESAAAGQEPARRFSLPRAPSPLGPDRYDCVILGAGCAGLSLCCRLLRRGYGGSILILDRKMGFHDDRTWCFWDVEPTPFSHLASKRWYSWTVRAGGREVHRGSGRYPYLCIAGADFYENALEYISRFPNASLALGQEARIGVEGPVGTEVETAEGRYRGGVVLDCRGLPPGAEELERARREANWVPQRFVGLRIRAGREIFDDSRITLMDFSVSQSRGLRFAYLLPFSASEALVENVYLSDSEVSAEECREEILEYLSREYGLADGDYQVAGEERGDIPMTDYSFPRRAQNGGRVYNVGMAGGETRPSTGYTFLRIQRYCERLADGLLRGEAPPPRGEARRYDVLDSLFLRLMRRRPELCPELHLRMFERVPPDPMVRFLTERSSPLDEARLLRALPKTPFLAEAGRAVLEALGEAASRKS